MNRTGRFFTDNWCLFKIAPFFYHFSFYPAISFLVEDEMAQSVITQTQKTAAPLEQYEWDNVWMEHTEDLTSPRWLYIGDSISIPTRVQMNALLNGAARVDGFATSKAADNPFFADAVRLFSAQQVSPVSVVLFNNGLHGWHLNDETEYPHHYDRLVTELRMIFPKATFIITLTTPLADPAQNKRVLARNRSAAAAAQKHGFPVLDYDPPLSALSVVHSPDGVHLTDDAYRILAETAVTSVNSRIDRFLNR